MWIVFGVIVFGVSLVYDITTWIMWIGIVLVLLRELYRFLFGG